MRGQLITIFFLAFAMQLAAQSTSIDGYFDLDFARGCEGLTVTATLNGTAPASCAGNACDIFTGDGNQQKALTYTYTQEGPYYFRILFPGSETDSILVDITFSEPPEFNAFLCSNERVEIQINDTNYDQYVIDDDNGNQFTVPLGGADQILTYPDNTTRNITVRGLNNNAADNCQSSVATVTPVTNLPQGVISSLEVISADQVVLEYNLDPNIEYELQGAANGTGSFATIKTISPASSPDTLNLNVATNYFCFRLATINSCINSPDSFSEIICSVLLDVNFDDNVNILNWQTESPTDFDICKNTDCGFVNVAGTLRTLEDREIACNTDYEYQLIANYASGSTSTSISVLGTSFSTQPPDSVANITTVFSGSDLTITWPPPPNAVIERYQVYRKNDNGDETFLGNATTPDFFIENANIDQCFVIYAIDQCDNRTAPSITACTMALVGSIDETNTVTLDWADYEGFADGVSGYIVEQILPDGSTITQNVSVSEFQTVNIQNNNQVLQYRVYANANDPSIPAAISNSIRIVKPINLYVPDAFTPDNDGLNDYFVIGARFVQTFDLKLFNRWGELIFSSSSIDNRWNGQFNSNDLQEGSYVYRLRITDQAGRDIEKTGTVLLVRN